MVPRFGPAHNAPPVRRRCAAGAPPVRVHPPALC